MRENIGKYRGFSKEDKKWVFGNLIVNELKANSVDRYFIVGYAFEEIEANDEEVLTIGEYAEVYPNTVGQFTGLYDCTKWENLTEEERTDWYKQVKVPSEWEGRPIYEGDVVKWGHLNEFSKENTARIAEVKFNPDIQFHSQVGVFNFGSFSYAETTQRDLEIIGNIHGNPELVK